VQFGELGTFYLSLSSNGAAKEEDFNLGQCIKGLYLCFAPSRTDVNNLSSKMLKQKASFMNVKDLTATGKQTSSPSSGGGSTSGNHSGNDDDDIITD
jgi:hypothetical protein